MLRVNQYRIPNWEFILICVCTIYYIVPGMQAIFPFYFFLVIEIFYSFYLISINKVNTREICKFVTLIFFIALLYALLTDAASIAQNVSHRSLKRFLSKFMQYSCMFFPLLFFKRCVIAGTRKQNLILLSISVLAMIMACGPILEMIARNPLAARDFGDKEMSQDIENFMPPYPFVYGMTFAFLCVCFFAKKVDSRFVVLKFVFIGFSVFFFYFLFKSQFTLALLTTIFSLSIIFVRDIRRFDLKFLFLCGVFIFFAFLPILLDAIIPLLPEMLANRFGEIYDFYTGNTVNDDSDLMGRLDLYARSIAAFFHSPIWGNRYLDFDGHATYLTVWADLGILGGIPLFTLLFKSKRMVSKLLGNMYMLFTPFFIHLFLNGFTNPIHASLQIYICLWFLIPLCLHTFSNKIKL